MKLAHLKNIALIVCTLFFSCPAWGTAKYTYQYTPGCQAAYNHYLSLRLAKGNAAIKQEIINNPYNLMATYIADYEDCMLLLFNGDKNDLAQRRKHQEERLALLGKGDAGSPFHRFCQAGIYLHWALVHIRFGEDWKAAMLFRKSFNLLKENKRLFPHFEYNDIFFSMEEAVVGAIPDNYKWVASIFGMKGNINHGVGELEKFVRRHSANDLLYNEAVIFYCYLKFYLQSKQEEVWAFLNSSQYSTDKNLMNGFVKANIALNYRKADVALQILNAMRSEQEYNMFPIFDYEMGCAYQMKLEDVSISYLQRFIQRFRGRLFVKDALQKIALQYYMRNDIQQATQYRSKVAAAGNTQVDADKQAQRFSEHKDWPDVTLLKVRLLIDGGYYSRALNIIGVKKELDFINISDRLEYNFRFGRVYDELGEDKKAANYYNRTIDIGKDRTEYFAARAALQLGLMYEKNNSLREAITAYRLCLSMKGHDFQNSIDQQAKAGLNRLLVK